MLQAQTVEIVILTEAAGFSSINFFKNTVRWLRKRNGHLLVGLPAHLNLTSFANGTVVGRNFGPASPNIVKEYIEQKISHMSPMSPNVSFSMSPNVSRVFHCLPCVSHCLPLSPIFFPNVSQCLPMSPILSSNVSRLSPVCLLFEFYIRDSVFSKYPFFLRSSLLCKYIEVEGLSEFDAIKKTGLVRGRTLVINDWDTG